MSEKLFDVITTVEVATKILSPLSSPQLKLPDLCAPPGLATVVNRCTEPCRPASPEKTEELVDQLAENEARVAAERRRREIEASLAESRPVASQSPSTPPRRRNRSPER